MISITNYCLKGNRKIHFSDGTEKTIDFNSYTEDDDLSMPLYDHAYFQKAALYENGRGIYWPNDYDFCPDFLHQYEGDEKIMVKDHN